MDQVRAFQYLKMSRTGRHIRKALRINDLNICIIPSASRIRKNKRVTDMDIPDMIWKSLQVCQMVITLKH